jgi:hypothetical protein
VEHEAPVAQADDGHARADVADDERERAARHPEVGGERLER